MFNTVPLIQITRGSQLEVVYRGAIAVADARGGVVASAGDPNLTTFLRSSAKPFQLLPLVESGAADRFGFSERELALMAASHNGEEFHVQAVAGILAIGMQARCSAASIRLHPPAARALEDSGQSPSRSTTIAPANIAGCWRNAWTASCRLRRTSILSTRFKSRSSRRWPNWPASNPTRLARRPTAAACRRLPSRSPPLGVARLRVRLGQPRRSALSESRRSVAPGDGSPDRG